MHTWAPKTKGHFFQKIHCWYDLFIISHTLLYNLWSAGARLVIPSIIFFNSSTVVVSYKKTRFSHLFIIFFNSGEIMTFRFTINILFTDSFLYASMKAIGCLSVSVPLELHPHRIAPTGWNIFSSPCGWL